MMRQLRKLLFPFSWVYGCVTALRNQLYDSGILKSYVIPQKSIVVGNLSAGGTGKSPHIVYLIEYLKKNHSVAVLSRGYGRTTKGVREVSVGDDASSVGDEPLMFKERFKNDVAVWVAEKRKEGVLEIERDAVVLLDDAFQHRKVEPGFSILLTTYNDPFYADLVLPAGNLREWKTGKNRADCVVVTKCPDDLSDDQQSTIRKKINMPSKPIFFSRFKYGELVPFGKEIDGFENVLLVTGIANPEPLKTWLKRFYSVELMKFPDHHNFSASDIAKIRLKFDTFAAQGKAVITTEKDYVRLKSILTEKDLNEIPLFYQAIKVEFNNEEAFNTLIKEYVDTI